VSDFLALPYCPAPFQTLSMWDRRRRLGPRELGWPRIPVDHEPYLLQARIVSEHGTAPNRGLRGSCRTCSRTLHAAARRSDRMRVDHAGWRPGARLAPLRLRSLAEASRGVRLLQWSVDIEEERSPLLGRNGIGIEVFGKRWNPEPRFLPGMLRRQDAHSEMDTIPPVTGDGLVRMQCLDQTGPLLEPMRDKWFCRTAPSRGRQTRARVRTDHPRILRRSARKQ